MKDQFIIKDPNDPERLKGMVVTLVLDEEENRIKFLCDMPENPTKNEIGYFQLICIEIAGQLNLINLESRRIYEVSEEERKRLGI